MNAVPMTARVRCKNKACGQKVPLSVEHVRQLGGKLRAEVVCPTCGERFVPSLVRTVKTTADDPTAEAPPPIPIPVPAGAKQAVPPFRPLPPTPTRSAAAAPPPIAWQPDPSPADPMPFSPLQADAGDRGPGGGLGGWWKRLSKNTQYLILGGGVAVMAVFAFAVQTLGNRPAEEPPPPPVTAPVTPATQTAPTTPSTTPATTKRANVPPLRPPPAPPAPTIDVPPADEYKLTDPTAPTTPRR